MGMADERGERGEDGEESALAGGGVEGGKPPVGSASGSDGCGEDRRPEVPLGEEVRAVPEDVIIIRGAGREAEGA